MSASFEIQFIAVIVAVSCALPGTFLLLRGMSMMADSITHTILLGIVLAFFITRDLSSPFLIIGAALVGVLTVWLTETLAKTRLVSEDSAIGIVFPLLFSIAVILITRYAGSSHLDTDSVLLGELAFAPFDRLIVGGIDIGAKAIYTSGAVLILNVILMLIFYKELKIASFDPALAAVLGLAPGFVHYGLMTAVSLTAVASFEAVGSILVVAFMIAPPATAYLVTDKLKNMLILSVFFGALSGIIGFRLAMVFDVSIAGSMAVVSGLIFALIFIFAPKRSLIGVLLKKQRQRRDFARYMLLGHLCDTGGQSLQDIAKLLNWKKKRFSRTLSDLLKNGKIEMSGEMVFATACGRGDYTDFVKSLCSEA